MKKFVIAALATLAISSTMPRAHAHGNVLGMIMPAMQHLLHQRPQGHPQSYGRPQQYGGRDSGYLREVPQQRTYGHQEVEIIQSRRVEEHIVSPPVVQTASCNPCQQPAPPVRTSCNPCGASRPVAHRRARHVVSRCNPCGASQPVVPTATVIVKAVGPGAVATGTASVAASTCTTCGIQPRVVVPAPTQSCEGKPACVPAGYSGPSVTVAGAPATVSWTSQGKNDQCVGKPKMTAFSCVSPASGKTVNCYCD